MMCLQFEATTFFFFSFLSTKNPRKTQKIGHNGSDEKMAAVIR